MTNNSLPCFDFYGMKVSSFSRDELRDQIIRDFGANQSRVYFGLSIRSFYEMKRYPALLDYYNSFDVIVTDGTPFYYLCRILGFPVRFNISVPNLVYLTLKLAEQHKKSIMLFGARPETNAIAADRLQAEYPGIKMLDGRDGYFRKEEEEGIVEEINSKKPDVLLIGITWPIKERFTHQWKNDIHAGIIIPCGGMIDVFAGKTRLTPAWLKKLGLASLFRMMQEPKRLFSQTVRVYFVFIFNFLPLFVTRKITGRKFSVRELIK